MNHRVFERTLRLLVFREARLFERQQNPPAPGLFRGLGPAGAGTGRRASVRAGLPPLKGVEVSGVRPGSRRLVSTYRPKRPGSLRLKP